MILKERTESVQYRILESLNFRKILSSSEKTQFENQVKGFNGEKQFDNELKRACIDGLVINDLLLKASDTYYQIDSLLITTDRIYLYEIKNYSGTFHFRDGNLYSESGHIIQSHSAQADRKKAYLHNLLLKYGNQKTISTYVVYINPDFYIYSLPKMDSVIFSGQLANHFKDIKNNAPFLSESSFKMADKLVSLHDDCYRPSNLPEYEFTQLKKGILCPDCFSFDFTASRQFRICSNCGCREKTSEAILRSVEEYRLLFPEKQITKHLIYLWCGSVWSVSRIQDVLSSNFHTHYSGRSSYYS
ncbi:nuclease-related domain-containing protein [Alkalibacterium olivapovliticus]|uniref:Nuclease-like protein n=1 Tax=Alkalibacterium olivapovliticus TaxID=99907 RepID=A0A2T0VTL3_9LACT|nr:nuclease-related domain-containing protein [Alkalibacterium olivapovliticus]PRY74534.1 nuclease-like protein [Alkalibacterium olivapovliticus]